MASLLFLFGFVFFTFSYAQQIGVNTPLGTVSGFHVDYGNDTNQMYFGAADVFLGIPYAEAPIGNLRYSLPKPLFQYPGRYVDASKYGPACPQPADGCLGLPTSEDCLYLNVFTPSTTVPNKYPVMVWIHGGAFITGCGPKYPYKGAIRNLVSRGVVVVTLQYRLGVPGFFTTKTNDFPPNRGLYDQLEALTWVTKNIVYFGGNPKQITLFGQSSGSISVSAHTYSPLSQNLFQQAIQESNGVLTAFDGALNYSPLNQQRAQQLCNFTNDQWNAGNFSALKPCMLAKKPEDWIPLEADNDFGWPIMVDKQFFPDLPRNLKRPEIPTIVGNMRDEWSSVWYGMLGGGMPFEAFNKDLIDGFLGEVGTFWGDNQQQIMELIEAAYRLENASDTDSAAWFRSGSDIFTALMYTQFVLQDAGDRLTKGNKNVFFYEQDYSSILMYNVDISSQLNGYKPVPHSSELPYIWMMDQIWENAVTNNMLKDADYELLEFYGSSWTNFAKTGKPTLDNSWMAATDRKNISYFVIDSKATGGMTMNRGFRIRDDNVFNQLITSIAGIRPPHA